MQMILPPVAGEPLYDGVQIVRVYIRAAHRVENHLRKIPANDGAAKSSATSSEIDHGEELGISGAGSTESASRNIAMSSASRLVNVLGVGSNCPAGEWEKNVNDM